ncbi:MAG: hypothetical protein SPI16_07315 [Porphyromonas sp.]|uniref:hypothetical protein n=1 Tax=Porphyromonas sp. TaxID=1924944 RepID=UPI002A911AF7|nr:hypothetical protein [Porphyromonas sp.]MDD7468282.1 hypothetical protein [Bacteroidales bacterium]MDY6102834.1 hypothetical protein [Porphyromonas sp.]
MRHQLITTAFLALTLSLVAAAQEKDRLHLSASAGVITPRLHPIGEVSLRGTDTLFSPKLCVDFSLSYTDGQQTEDEMRAAWTGGLPNRYIGNYQLRHTVSRRMEFLAGSTLRWMISDRDWIGLSGNLRLQDTWDHRYHLGVNNIVPLEVEGHTTYSGELERLTRAGGTLPDRFPGWNGARLKQQLTGGLTLSGEHRLPSSSAHLTWSIDHQRHEEDCPNERVVAHHLPDTEVRTEIGDRHLPRLSYEEVSERSYGFRKISEKTTHLGEMSYGAKAKMNLKLLEGDLTLYLSGRRLQATESDTSDKVYPLLSARFPTFASMPKRDLTDATYLGGRGVLYSLGSLVDQRYVHDLDTWDAKSFSRSPNIPSYLPASFDVVTDQAEGLVECRRDLLSDRLFLTLGSSIRSYRLSYFCHTVVENRAGEDVSDTKQYFALLPYLSLDHKSERGWLSSLSLSTDQVLSPYRGMIPYNKHSSTDHTVEMGQKGLRPEYRMSISAGVSKKWEENHLSASLDWIGSRDYLYRYVDPDLTREDFCKVIPRQKSAVPTDGHWSLETICNAPFAQSLGLTLEARYKLSHLPSSLLRPIGVRLKYRLIGSDTSPVETLHHTRREQISLPGIACNNLSSTIDYTTELWGVTVTGDYASDRCVSVGESARDDLYESASLRFSMEAHTRLSDRILLVFRGDNLLNTPIKLYQGSGDHLYQLAYEGPRLMLGFSYTLPD